MSLVKKFLYSNSIQKLLYKHGYIREDEFRKRVFLNAYPEKVQQRLENSFNKLEDTGFYTGIEDPIKEIAVLNHIAKTEANKEALTKAVNYLNNSVAVGYEPAGSILKRLYPKPFEIFGFIGNNYWAAVKARREVRIEIERDFYVLTAPERTSKARIKAVNAILDQLGIPQLWVEWSDQLNLFGNSWNLIDTNLLGGIKGKIEPLIPERVVPIYNLYKDEIVGWEYEWKGKTITFPLDSVDHLKTYSARSNQIGSPTLSSVVIEIEADIHATIYSNTLMQRGTLIKGILSLKNRNDDSVINEQSYWDYTNAVQTLINKKFSGVRHSGQLAVIPEADKYFDFNNNELDGIWKTTSDRTAARTGMLLGVPPERMGLRTTSQYKNDQEINDSLSLSFDNNQYYLTTIVANYINEKILKERLGIEDIQIQASGEYGAISKSAAAFGQLISQMGVGIMSVDEFRTKTLHWEPLGGPEGAELIGKIKENPQTLAKAVGPAFVPEVWAGTKKILKHKPQHIRYY